MGNWYTVFTYNKWSANYNVDKRVSLDNQYKIRKIISWESIQELIKKDVFVKM
jgi:hypothetical protein